MNEWFQWHSWSWCVCDIVDGRVTILLAVGFNGTATDNMSDIVDGCVAIFTSTLSGSMATDNMSDIVDGFVATGGDNVKIICPTPPTSLLMISIITSHFRFQVKTARC